MITVRPNKNYTLDLSAGGKDGNYLVWAATMPVDAW